MENTLAEHLVKDHNMGELTVSYMNDGYMQRAHEILHDRGKPQPEPTDEELKQSGLVG